MKKEATSLTTVELAQELIEKGHNVKIIGKKGHTIDTKNIPIIEFKNGFLHTLFSPAFLLRKEKKIDIIYSVSSSPALFIRSLLTKLFTKKPLLVHTLKSYPIIRDIKIKKKNKFISYIANSCYWLLKYADFVTVSTNVHADKLIKKGVPKDKIRVVRSFIDHNKFMPLKRLSLKRKYGYEGNKIILYYGALWEIKGSNILIKAIPKILEEHEKNIFICIPRNFTYSLKYKSYLEMKGFARQINFIAEEVKIEDYVAMADLVILPYPHLEGTEGNPSCLLEAMACKTPVVTTDLPELREIADGCVFMAKPGNVESLQETIIYALKNPDLEMVEKAYQKSQEFSVEKITQQFIELYEELLKDKKN
ncbi:glycosyltransferase family 4 protein [Candidatus Woesearchaeota archaeon]|nr:glycosyltransferase family 4 protein [Candidatus Woesearchaeota archaeon]MBT5342931.1 glycosyltransferase family 4 protein [Candidatus Woesearchaeota archaeon]